MLINGDTLNEPDESFLVQLSNAAAASILDGQGIGTITNDDPLPSLSIGDTNLAEGNSGSSNASFTVSLSAVSGRTVTVQYATADGTANAGSDYQTAGGTVTFNSGDTSKTITVPVTVTNTSGAPAYLNAWIDFNNNGVLTDPGEQIAASVLIANGTSGATQNVVFTVPASAVTSSNVGARFRITDEAGAGRAENHVGHDHAGLQ